MLRLPRTLFARALLIHVLPLVLVQMVAAWVFFTVQWSVVSSRLLEGVRGEVAVLVHLVRDPAPDRQARLDAALHRSWLAATLLPAGSAQANRFQPAISDNSLARDLATRLAERIDLPTRIELDYQSPQSVVAFRLPMGEILRIRFPRKRLYHPVFYVFIPWMLASSAVLLLISLPLLRNQLRAVRRLAAVAEQLGQGRDVSDFRPEGALEVRQAARSLLRMRNRLLEEVSRQQIILAGISHDLRTPLTRLRLQISMLPEAVGASGDGAALLEEISEMEALIDRYLLLVRTGTGLQRSRMDVAALLSGLPGTRDGPDAGRITLVMPDTPSAILADWDPGLISRCLENLVQNALRYAGRAVISLEPCPPDRVLIRVDDDGPGIPPEERSLVLRPFHRIEQSRNQALGGVGLGLTIADQAVRAHGGTLELGDSPLGGLRVELVLPLYGESTGTPA